jgi:hypothetical protein
MRFCAGLLRLDDPSGVRGKIDVSNLDQLFFGTSTILENDYFSSVL